MFQLTSDTLTQGTHTQLIKSQLALQQHFSEASALLIQSHPKVFSAVSVLDMALLLSFACDATVSATYAPQRGCPAKPLTFTDCLPALCEALGSEVLTLFPLPLKGLIHTIFPWHSKLQHDKVLLYLWHRNDVWSQCGGGTWAVCPTLLPVAGPRSPDVALGVFSGSRTNVANRSPHGFFHLWQMVMLLLMLSAMIWSTWAFCQWLGISPRGLG